MTTPGLKELNTQLRKIENMTNHIADIRGIVNDAGGFDICIEGNGDVSINMAGDLETVIVVPRHP